MNKQLRNFFTLCLALFLLSITAFAAGDGFSDSAEISPRYKDAVKYASQSGIIQGYADGRFVPKGQLTRGAAAKFISAMCLGAEAANGLSISDAPYPDVPADHTFAGHIGYCSLKGYISGYDDGTFKAGNPLTGFAFAKMLLNAIEYPSAAEYTGEDWKSTVYRDAAACGIFAGDMEFQPADILNREQASFMLYNAANWKASEKGGAPTTEPESTVPEPSQEDIPSFSLPLRQLTISRIATIDVTFNKECTVNYRCIPEDQNYFQVHWERRNGNVCPVSITPLNNGRAQIVFTSDLNDEVIFVDVTVEGMRDRNILSVSDTQLITSESTSINVTFEASGRVTYQCVPATQNFFRLKWGSFVNGVAPLYITPISNGTAGVLISNDYNDETVYVTITVQGIDIYPNMIYSPTSMLSMKVGDKQKLDIVYSPSNTTKRSLLCFSAKSRRDTPGYAKNSPERQMAETPENQGFAAICRLT